jgi:3-dehydroquinate synthase
MGAHKHRSLTDPSINILWRTSFNVETKIFVGQGVVNRIPGLLSQSDAGKKVLLLRQSPAFEILRCGLAQELSDQGYELFDLVLPDGEACKSSESLLAVWQKLQELGFARNDTIVALGGGAISDLSGFAAATYLRGIHLYIIPTTLLAQVDAAIGGKTGINLGVGKNLAGAFYFPKAILVDTGSLATLPPRQISSGLAEVIKYALLEKTIANETEYQSGPKPLWDLLEKDLKSEEFYADPLCYGIITSAIKMKLGVVAKDPTETGLRRCLNLGHTVGHAVEKASAYSLTHGEAVAIGLVFATNLSVKLGLINAGLTESLQKLLGRVHLPTFVPKSITLDQINNALFHDKKRQGDEYQLILPLEEIGRVNYSYRIKREDLASHVEAFLARA